MGPNDPVRAYLQNPKTGNGAQEERLPDISIGLGLDAREPLDLKRQRRKERKAKTTYLILKERIYSGTNDLPYKRCLPNSG